MSEEKRAGAKEAAKSKAAGLKSNAWTDLALVLPIFVAYHLGVSTLKVRNAADLVTSWLASLAAHNQLLYWGLTLCVGLALVAVLYIVGRGQAFDFKRFGLVIVEGVLYAVIMGATASYVVGVLPRGLALGSSPPFGAWPGVVMSLGAGLYEEIAFRVGLFGVVAWGVRALISKGNKRTVLLVIWCFAAAAVFSGWHYVGELGDPWDTRSFVFRWVCGVVFTGIFVFRGFAPAVWTHVLYDVWVLVLRHAID